MSTSLQVGEQDEQDGRHRRRGMFRATARRDLTYRPRHLQVEHEHRWAWEEGTAGFGYHYCTECGHIDGDAELKPSLPLPAERTASA